MNAKKTAGIVVVLLIVFLTVSYLSYPLVGPDSGYYLSMAREFYSGKIYFVDIATSYNPLAVIVLGLPYLFQNSPDFRLSLLINFIVIWTSSYILFSILQKINNAKKDNLFYSLFFVLASLMLDGSQIMLEPISVFFQLTGLLLYLMYRDSEKYRYLFFAGITIALSFLSKQYGMFILAPIGIDILINRKAIFKKSAIMALGFLVPIGLFFLYLTGNGASFIESINYMLGRGIHYDRGNGTGINYSTSTYLIGFSAFIACNLYLLLVPVLLLKIRKNFDYKGLLFISVLPFSLLVLIPASYPHYFQYVLPYALMAFVYLLSITDSSRIRKFSTVAFAISILIMGIVAAVSYSRRDVKIDWQETFIKEVSAQIPKQSKVFIDGANPALYYLCDFQSINLKKIGFTFPGYFYPKTIVQYRESNSYLIVTKEALLSYKGLLDEFSGKEITIKNQTYHIIKME